MKVLTLVTVAALLLGQGVARAQDATADDQQAQIAQPPTGAPTAQPPQPPQEVPAPPATQAAPAEAQSAEAVDESATGQWVYTSQYGWLWMPYGDQYVVQNDSPYAYCYYPNYGWTWLSAPWVVGLGVRPFFGHWGPARFAWWRGWGPRFYGYRGYGRGYGGYRGFYRAPAYRGFGGVRGGTVGRFGGHVGGGGGTHFGGGGHFNGGGHFSGGGHFGGGGGGHFGGGHGGHR